jgi:hypothetical protein
MKRSDESSERTVKGNTGEHSGGTTAVNNTIKLEKIQKSTRKRL